MEHVYTTTGEASKSISSQSVLSDIHSKLSEMQAEGRRPLIILKKELPEVTGLPFVELRPVLVELYRSGLLSFGKTLNGEYFTIPDL